MFGKSLIKGIGLIINIIVVVALFIALLASGINPQTATFPAYFTMAFPVVVILNIGFVLLWVFARKKQFLLSLVVLIYAWPQISMVFPLQFEQVQVEPTDKIIKVLSYNTMLNALLVKHTKRSPNPVIQYILDENADLVCLQEFAVSSNRDFLTYRDVLKSLGKKYPYSHISFKYESGLGKVGAATFSKYPIVNKGESNYDSEYNLCQFSDINVAGQIIRLINVHLESNKLTSTEKAMPVDLKNNFNAEKLSSTTLYLSKKLDEAYRIRATQADSVASLIGRTSSKLILCGDFNDIPLSYAYTKVRGELNDAFEDTGNGFGWTFNESFFRFRIDYIMHSEGFNSTSFKVGKLKYSDHYPIVSEININTLNNLKH